MHHLYLTIYFYSLPIRAHIGLAAYIPNETMSSLSGLAMVNNSS